MSFSVEIPISSLKKDSPSPTRSPYRCVHGKIERLRSTVYPYPLGPVKPHKAQRPSVPRIRRVDHLRIVHVLRILRILLPQDHLR